MNAYIVLTSLTEADGMEYFQMRQAIEDSAETHRHLTDYFGPLTSIIVTRKTLKDVANSLADSCNVLVLRLGKEDPCWKGLDGKMWGWLQTHFA